MFVHLTSNDIVRASQVSVLAWDQLQGTATLVALQFVAWKSCGITHVGAEDGIAWAVFLHMLSMYPLVCALLVAIVAARGAFGAGVAIVFVQITLGHLSPALPAFDYTTDTVPQVNWEITQLPLPVAALGDKRTLASEVLHGPIVPHVRVVYRFGLSTEGAGVVPLQPTTQTGLAHIVPAAYDLLRLVQQSATYLADLII